MVRTTQTLLWTLPSHCDADVCALQPCRTKQATSIEPHGMIPTPPRLPAEPPRAALQCWCNPFRSWRAQTPSLTAKARGLTVTHPAGKFWALLLGGDKPSTISWLRYAGNCSGSGAESSPKPHWLLFLHSCWDKWRHQSCHRCRRSGYNPPIVHGSKQEHPKPREGWDLPPFIHTRSLSHALNHFAYWNVSVDNHCQNTTQNPPKSTTGSGNHDLPFYNINA